MPGAAGCQHRNKKGIQGNEKLGKIKTGNTHFFHINVELDSGACGKRMSLRPKNLVFCFFSLEELEVQNQLEHVTESLESPWLLGDC